jgi:hypothetical protein
LSRAGTGARSSTTPRSLAHESSTRKPEVGGEAEVGERLRHLRQAQLRVGGEAHLQAEERGDDPKADDHSFGAGHVQVGREGQPGLSTPNCFAYSAFNRCSRRTSWPRGRRCVQWADRREAAPAHRGDVPARSAHRYESTVDVVPKREPERLYSRQGIFCEPCLATPSGLPVRKPTSRAGRAKPWQDAGGRCARAAEMDQGDESRLEARDDKKLSTLGRYAVPKCGFLTTSLPPFQASRALWRVVWPSVRSVDAGPRRPRCWEAALCGLASSTNRPLAGTLGAFWVLKLGAMQGISGPWERRSGP